MPKKEPTTAIGQARDRRGLTQRKLSELSGYSDTTVRAAEAKPKAVAHATINAILRALASVAPFTDVELFELARETGLDFHAIDQLSDSARGRPPAAGEGRERIARQLAHFEDDLDQLAELLDALSRFRAKVVSKAQTDLAGSPDLLEFVRTMQHRYLVELHMEYDPDPAVEMGSFRFVATLPREVECVGGESRWPAVYQDESGRPVQLPGERRRVVYPTETLPDGTTVDRYAYYTPEGRRLIPIDELPPRDDPKSDTGS